MTSDTFKSRLGKLILKSKRALRIYSQASSRAAASKPLADQQVAIWYEVNEDLLNLLIEFTQESHLRLVVRKVFKAAEKYQKTIGQLESKIADRHRILEISVDNRKYSNVIAISREIIEARTYLQAYGAVIAELESLLLLANVSLPTAIVQQRMEQERLQITGSKIIPFRKSQSKIN